MAAGNRPICCVWLRESGRCSGAVALDRGGEGDGGLPEGNRYCSRLDWLRELRWAFRIT
jgi:hypothetical protein